MPSIIEVISPYTELRQAGKEFIGLCPLHNEKSPSFTVNEEKGLFYCHGCHAGGDALTFIQLLKGVDFKEARVILGLDSGSQQRPESRTRAEAALDSASKTLADWSVKMSIKIGERMRTLGQVMRIAKETLQIIPGGEPNLMKEVIYSCQRKWMILEVLDDDLANPDLLLSLWRQRKDIERLVDQA